MGKAEEGDAIGAHAQGRRTYLGKAHGFSELYGQFGNSALKCGWNTVVVVGSRSFGSPYLCARAEELTLTATRSG